MAFLPDLWRSGIRVALASCMFVRWRIAYRKIETEALPSFNRVGTSVRLSRVSFFDGPLVAIA